MPRSWYDYHANALPDHATDEQVAEREFNLRILADRKPYFMRYIYPTLMKDYKAYMKSVETKCVREFRMPLEELLAIPEDEQTDGQKQFLAYYHRRMPVGEHNCTMNRICRKIEDMFDGRMKQWTEEPFDYTIMKSGCEYTPAQFAQVKKLYDQHHEWLCEHAKILSSKRKTEMDPDGNDAKLWQSWFRQQAMQVCSNEMTLCDIVLDLCYRRSGTKEFAWDVCAHQIAENLARRHDGIVRYPTEDPDGDIEYAGRRFSMAEAEWISEETEEELIEGDSAERDGMGEGSD